MGRGHPPGRARASGGPGVPAWHLGACLAGLRPPPPQGTDLSPHPPSPLSTGGAATALPKIPRWGRPQQKHENPSFRLVPAGFWHPRRERAGRSGARGARGWSTQHREPSKLGNTNPPSHWDKQGGTVSCVDYRLRLTTSGEMNPVCGSAPCPAVTQRWSLSWEMTGLCRVPRQTCPHWLFSAFAVFVLGQERCNVRSRGLLRSHMIYAFSFGCVFLLGHLQFALRNMNF